MSFSLEAEVVWGRKMSANMSLLLLNRYMTLFAYIPTSVLLFNRPGNFGIELGCPSVAYFPGAMSALSQAIVVYFSVVRTLAIYERDFRVACVVVPFGIVTVTVSAWAVSQLDTLAIGESSEEIRACFPLLQGSKSFIAAWSCSMVFNALIFSLVVTKTVRIHLEYRRLRLSGGSRLVDKLMGHEIRYFGVVLAISLSSLLLLTFQSRSSFNSVSGRNNEIVRSVSSALLSRMVFGLKQEGLDVNASAERTLVLSSIYFHRSDRTNILHNDFDGLQREFMAPLNTSED